MEASSRLELQQAHTELWNLTFSYLKSMALECVVQLNIPNVIHNFGGNATLPSILSAIQVPEHRKPYLPRLMRFLVVSGILSFDSPTLGEEGTYHLTPLSRLLVDDTHINGYGSLGPFVLSQTTKYHVSSATYLSEWFKGEDGAGPMAAEMPFKMAHGTGPWGALGHDQQFNRVFNAGLGSNSRLVLDFVVAEYGDVFDGVSSLLDVGGGDGSTARTIRKAFPHIKCSVLDLPNVIIDIQPGDGMVDYIAGDMFSSIPPTDAIMLKVCIL
jgi:trans-resveratrol di-O-methyltransferase